MAEGEAAGGSEAAETATPEDDAGSREEGTGRYSVVWRSVRTAWGSESYLLRSYAVVGSLVALFVAVAVVLAFPSWVAGSASGTTQAFSRAFLLLLGLAVIAPLLAPALFAARRHRGGTATVRRDALYGLSGYLFVLSLYAALLISAPASMREEPPGVIAPAVEFLYGLDPIYAFVPPVLGLAVVVAADRL
jgi:multisubunit Na+/H+ antiporter MnhG subunit